MNFDTFASCFDTRQIVFSSCVMLWVSFLVLRVVVLMLVIERARLALILKFLLRQLVIFVTLAHLGLCFMLRSHLVSTALTY